MLTIDHGFIDHANAGNESKDVEKVDSSNKVKHVKSFDIFKSFWTVLKNQTMA